MTKLLINIECRDRTGLISAVTAALFDVGADLGETAFAAVGGRAEFTSECVVPADVTVGDVDAALKALPELAGAKVTVEEGSAPSDRATHRIIVSGGNRPGLLARLSEALVAYEANILRLDASLIPGPGGDRYVTRLAVAIPPRSTQACLATVANTAGELRLDCHAEEA